MQTTSGKVLGNVRYDSGCILQHLITDEMIPMTDVADFWRHLHHAVIQRRTAEKDIRLGQAYFNSLFMLRPNISENIRGTDADPYYTDSNLPTFFMAIAQHLDTNDE